MGYEEGSAAEVVDHDHEGLDVINNQAAHSAEGDEAVEHGEDELSIRDLYSGVQSLI